MDSLLNVNIILLYYVENSKKIFWCHLEKLYRTLWLSSKNTFQKLRLCIKNLFIIEIFQLYSNVSNLRKKWQLHIEQYFGNRTFTSKRKLRFYKLFLQLNDVLKLFFIYFLHNLPIKMVFYRLKWNIFIISIWFYCIRLKRCHRNMKTLICFLEWYLFLNFIFHWEITLLIETFYELVTLCIKFYDMEKYCVVVF